MGKPACNAVRWMVLMVCLIALGCTPRVVLKVPQEGRLDIRTNTISKEERGIRVSVQSEGWSYEPYALEQYVTPFFFLIKNETEEKVSFRLSDVILFDEFGNQFNAMSADDVEMVLATRDLFGRGSYPSLYFRYDEFRSPYAFGWEIPAYAKRPLSFITLLGLPIGEIHPKSQVRGYVYFRKATSYGKTLQLKVHLDGFDNHFEFDVKK